MKLIDLAKRYRAKNPHPNGGYVVIYQGEVSGWTAGLAAPESWRPDCMAVSEDGLCYEAQGGDDYKGAKSWKLCGDARSGKGGAA